MKRRKESGNFK